MRRTKQQELQEYIEEMKTIKKLLLDKEAKFLQVEGYKCVTAGGMTVYREKLLKNNSDGSAVIILPITIDKDVVLTIQPRVFTKSTVGISLPAGYVDDNEAYEVAARRELREETGYETNELIECCSYYQDDGCSAAYNKGYVALDCQRVGKQRLDKDEFIRYFKCHYDELEELVEEGMILDGGSQLVIEKAKKYVKK